MSKFSIFFTKKPYGSMQDHSCNDENNHSIENESRYRCHGLSIFSAAIFIAAEMAGTGILALPKAVETYGWSGLVLLVILCLNAAYSGATLGDCWAILEERYAEYRISTRNPYPLIAYHAIGNWGSYLVSICIQLTSFGVGTVCLLLASRTIQELLQDFLPEIGFCIWFVIFAALLCIPMWLGSPKDFWLIGIGALIMTISSCIFIIIQIIIDYIHISTPPKHGNYSYTEYFLTFGTLLFSFGGAATFPTIQNDMVDRNNFYKSIRIAFAVILALYLPIAALGHITYGIDIKTNVIDSMSHSLFTSLAKFFMAWHLILAFIIIINPVSQDLEEILRIPKTFCIKRCILRTLILCLMVLIGELIPKFDNILSLVGGSTITLTTFVFPPLCYLELCDQKSNDWVSREVPMHLRVYLWMLIVIGITGGIASTYSATEQIISDQFTKPCFWS